MAEKTTSPSLRDLPKVDALLLTTDFEALAQRYGRTPVAQETRAALDALRQRLRTDNAVGPSELTPHGLATRVGKALEKLFAPRQCRVINATGVILHTSLGRAPLAPTAVEQAVREASGYSLLELDRESGKRSDRDKLVSDLICRVTGAQAATVVNNNAAATMIILNSLAEGKEVICSRAHMVEIGGSYRMPDVMRKAGCKLVEIGCTNKTHPRDYEEAITPQTSLLLKVHTSNYAVVGFTEEVSLPDLVAIGRKRNVPVFYDLGSGSLVDLAKYGIAREPSVPELLKQDLDVLCISGDKLLGGPQAGIIMGKPEIIQRVKKNALFRMVRCDKFTLSLLEATLKLYLDGDNAIKQVPTLAAITRDPIEVKLSAERICATLKRAGLDVSTASATSQVGGGSTPGEFLPTTVIAWRGPFQSVDDVARRLRLGTPCVFARIENDALLFDSRSLLPGQEEELAAAILAVKA
ncbi:MAG: L-seryl-tRNA(Sec) selenium transferase [Planctomycetes bacterium]|nr:L-seryl-tRNA(Sec) selenium transferase [Planctomycetota bacterium]